MELLECGRREPLVGQRDAELVALADVAAVEPCGHLDLSVRDAVLAQAGAQLLGCGGELVVEPRLVDRPLGHEDRAHLVVLEVARQQSHRRRDAGVRRHDHLGDAERLRDLGRLRRAAAAERDERELPRVMALLDGARADRARHVRVRDRDDSLGRFEQSEAEPVGEPLHRRGCELAVELHLAAEEAIGVDPPEHDVRVGQRRLLAALPVRGGAGRGTGAARADAEGAALVDVGDRAAAGADRVDVDHRHEQRVAGDPRVAGRRLADPAIGDDADVGRGAADVERDQAAPPRGLARPEAAEHAGRRAGEKQRHRLLRRRLDRGDAAVRHHHVQLSRHALGCERARQPFEVAAGGRPDERVHARGREALELAELREDVGAGGDERARHLLGDDLGRPPLVLRVQVREEEADRDRLDACVFECPGRSANLVLVERLDDLAGRRCDPLADHVPVASLHERLRLPRDVLHDRVVLRPLVAADVHDVAEALRRHHPGLRAAVLEHRVGRDGRPVEHRVEVGGSDTGIAAELAESRDERSPGVVGGRAHLVHVHDLRGRVVEHEVGEGAHRCRRRRPSSRRDCIARRDSV